MARALFKFLAVLREDFLNIFSTSLAVVLTLSTIAEASALDRRVQINNASSYNIVQFYASNKGSTSWEEDIFGDKYLPAGGSVIINIDDGSGYCKFDFLAVFEDGDQVVQPDNNVCEISTFTITD